MKVIPRFFRLRVLLVLSLVGLLGVIVSYDRFLLIKVIGWNYPVFLFRAACTHVPYKSEFGVPGLGFNKFAYVSGEYTEEFWTEIQKSMRYGPYLAPGEEHLIGQPYPGTNHRDGKVYVAIGWLLPVSGGNSRTDGEWEEYAHRHTSKAASKIFQRRQVEGAFEREDMSAYLTLEGPHFKTYDEPRVMASEQCGFIEELIVKGGRFTPAEITKRKSPDVQRLSE